MIMGAAEGKACGSPSGAQTCVSASSLVLASLKAIPREVCRARELDLRNYNLSKLGLGCLASVLHAGA